MVLFPIQPLTFHANIIDSHIRNKILSTKQRPSLFSTSTNWSAHTKSKHKKYLDLKYISSVIYRVLPNVKWNMSSYKNYYNDKTIKDFFSRIYPVNEYKSITKYFKNAGFDMTVYDQVKKDMVDYKSKLLMSASSAHNSYTNESGFLKMCGIKRAHIDFLNTMIVDELLSFQKGKDKEHFRKFRPSIDEVLTQINKKASSGMPEPWVKKGEIMSRLEVFLKKFYDCSLTFNDFSFSPSATLFRLTIRSSGVKFRVVHCVQALMATIETYYRMYFCNMLPDEYETIFLGKMQADIQRLSKKYSGYHIHSVDHSKWDIFRQPVLSVMFFSILENSLPLSAYEIKILRILRNIYLTMPSFHPSLPIMHRWIGTVSGSSFTTLDNSICNWLCVYIIIFEMYNGDLEAIKKLKLKIVLHGDDLLIISKVKIDMEKFFLYLNNKFKMSASMECKVSKPNKPEFYFLGSFWKNHKPRRKEGLLVALVLFGNTNFDKMSNEMLLQSRFFEIFGNSSQCKMFWEKLCKGNGMPPDKIFNRLYHFRDIRREFDGSPTRLDLKEVIIDAQSSRDSSRGYFYKRVWDTNDLKFLWKLR